MALTDGFLRTHEDEARAAARRGRDLSAELDALKEENDALRAALVKKGAVSEEDIEAEKTAQRRTPISRP